MKREHETERFPTRTRLLAAFMQGSKRWFTLSALMTFAVAMIDFVNPKIIGYTVDALIGATPEAAGSLTGRALGRLGGAAFVTGHLAAVAGIVMAVALCGALSRYLFRLFNAMGAEELLRTMRDRLFDQILHLPCAWYGGQQTGDIIQRCTSDVETVKTFVAERLTSLLRISVMLAMALYYMRLIHGKLTLVAFAFIPVIVGYSFIFHRHIGKAFSEADIQEGKLSAIAQENLTGVRVVRAFGRERHERKRFEQQNQRYTDMWVRLMKILTLY